MRRRVLLCLTLITMSACNGDKVVQPTGAPTAPTKDISDAVHGGINPDFFFLPPMVKQPSTNPPWDVGAFNPDLQPIVGICASDATRASEVATALCTPLTSLAATVNIAAEQYQANWAVPSDASTIFYRVSVTVGTTVLGFADVETGSNASQLKKLGTDEIIPLVDGRTLPVKFRIERFALCKVPGTGPCATKAIDVFGNGGEVSTPFGVRKKKIGVLFRKVTTSSLSTISATSTTQRPTITAEGCEDFRERDIPVTDLPAFGPCVRIRVEPALSGPLTEPALVFSCDVGPATLPEGMSVNQAKRITMHRLVGDKLEALPHDHPDCSEPTASQTISPENVRRMFAALGRGSVKSAAKQMLAMLAPKPLYAARFIDLGGGGSTHLSDEGGGVGSIRSAVDGPRLSMTASATSGRTFHEFQFLLPARFDYVFTATDRAAYPADQLSVSVRVTDLGNEPVINARVRFSADQGGTVTSAPTSTDGNGVATVPWIVSALSPNTLTATGFGIAGIDKNGPRNDGSTPDGIDDPFQPCDDDWETLTTSPACAANEKVTGVDKGSMTVTAITVGKIAGTVLNEQTGSPIEATVTYQPAWAGSTVSGSAGAFLISGLTPGPLSARVKYDLTFAAAKFHGGARGAVEVQPKATKDVGNVCLKPIPGKITGTVVSTLGNAAIDGATVSIVVTVAEVTACKIAASIHTVTTTTAEGGKFSLEVPPGSYAVLATAPEYDDGALVSAVVSADATTALEAPIALKWKFGKISGAVIDAEDNALKIAGATVTATLVPAAAASLTSGETFTTTTDADGKFRLEKLAPGSYNLSLQATDYDDGSFAPAVVEAAAINELASPIALRLKRGEFAASVVSTVNGGAVEGAKVTLIPDKEGALIKPAFTDAKGFFTFVGLRPGRYTIIIEADKHVTLTARLDIKPGPPVVTGALYQLRPNLTGDITGTVVDDVTGGVIAGAKVSLEGLSGTVSVSSDEYGKFGFAKPEPGTYSVTVGFAGYELTTRIKLEFTGESIALTIRLKRAPDPASVSVSVSVSPVSFTGACPAVFTFTGTITSTAAGVVTYRWLRSDGATAPEQTVTFTEPGTQTVSTTWTLSPASFAGWQQLRISSPDAVDSNQANFTLTCTSG